MESIEKFFDDIYDAAYFYSKNNISTYGDYTKGRREFTRFNNNYYKYIEICNIFSIENRFSDMLRSWVAARNCLTHRRGVVSIADVDDKAEGLLFQWTAPRFILENPGSGEKILLEEAAEREVIVEADSSLSVSIESRVKVFNIGQIIEFSPRELSQIFLCANFAISYTYNGVVDSLKNSGVLNDSVK